MIAAFLSRKKNMPFPQPTAPLNWSFFDTETLSPQVVSNDINGCFVQCVQQYRTAGRRSSGGDVVKAVETTGINL
jgi:hypothetical protein